MSIVTRENIGVLTERITVKVAQADYLPAFEKALKEYGRKANLPGFRKGMVPPGLIKKMYGSSVFADEVLRSVEKELTNFMVSEKLDIFAQPLPLPENDARQIDMTKPEEYSFAFEVGLKPDFQLPDLKALSPTRYQIQVTEAMIDEEQERLLVRAGKMTEPESVSGEDTVLNVSFQQVDASGQAVEGGIQKDNSLLVKYFKPEFRTQWIGKKKEDSIVCSLGEAFEDKEWGWVRSDLGLDDSPENQALTFKITIQKLGWIEKPALDEAFFKQIFPQREIRSLEEFRSAIREDIQKQLDNQTRSQLQHTLYHDLINKTQIDFPEIFLKKWLRSSSEKPKSDQDVEEEFPSFSDQLKWTMILDKIVHEQNLEATPEDIQNLARQQLMGYLGMHAASVEDQPWMADYLKRMMQDKKFIEDSVHRIRTDKVLQWAESQVSPLTKEISQEDFVKMQQEHQHHHHE